MLEEEPKEDAPKKRDWEATLDLNRTTLTKSMVDRMEAVLRQADAARDDLKEIVAECRDKEFRPHDIVAMKKIAKLRKDDKAGAAREELSALERVGKAVGFDLFDWATESA